MEGTIMKRISKFVAIAAMLAAVIGSANAGDRGTKPEATALAKKAVEFIQANGADKAYATFMDKTNATFHDRDLYVLVYDMNGNCLAHGNNPKLAGKNNMDSQDADGVYYVKDRMELAKSHVSFWQDYKFTNPVSKKIEPKSTYCEKLNQTVVCVGIYR